MKKLPAFAKNFSDLLPWARNKARKLFLRTAVTGMGALAIGPNLPASSATLASATNPVAVAILNRDKRSSARKLMLQIGNRAGAMLFASHGSHSSHSSHSSHASHYSSSTGSSPASTPETPQPSSDSSQSPAPGKSNLSSRAVSSFMTEDHAQTVVLKIADLNVKPGLRGAFLAGKDKSGTEFRFVLRPETTIRKISPAEVNLLLADILRQSSSSPFRIGEEVLVAWKVDPSTSLQTAVRVTVLE
jgi:hypothetical protein